ncbi:Homeobox-leucine zipper protein HOX19 [Platanthera zijinensis]|uniref:Homeobox-leucine zipper protein HOX19 n=1 Tax=Platanthera zijinensis TaxID=2320716 RepID=A0AAP0FX10_9ASPA
MSSFSATNIIKRRGTCTSASARRRKFKLQRRASLRVSADEEDDEAAAAPKKLLLTKEQSALLEGRFKEHTTLNPVQKQKQTPAKQLNLRPCQIEVWFHNRRARTKLKQTEVDCDFLMRCYEALTEENRRLQKELDEMKTLKFAAVPRPPPLFVQQCQRRLLFFCAAASPEPAIEKLPLTVLMMQWSLPVEGCR